jgi:hypothetical protein
MVSRHAESLGYQTEIERRLDAGGSVDVHLSREGFSIAIEIAIHSRPQRESRNIRKCLDVGYNRVLSLFLEPKLLHKTRAAFIKTDDERDRHKVAFGELERFNELLE